jgi:diacylglycerol O-acyltransferase
VSADLLPLSGLDALFLHLESPQMPMHVGSLSLIELPPGYRGNYLDDVRRHIASRLHLAPAFTRKLAEMPLGLANPVWVPAGEVDVTQHIHGLRLPRPGTLAQLEACVARLHAQPLDRSRPLWALYLIEGLKSGAIGYYAKVHHAAVDGAAGVELAKALLDVTPQPREVPPPDAPAPAAAAPGRVELLGAAARTTWNQLRKAAALLPTAARTGSQALTQTAGQLLFGGGATAAGALALGPRTALNGAISAQRAYATLSLPLAQAKATAAALGVTLNDLVLAVCAGALRDWLAQHGGVPRQPLYAGVPFSVRARGDARSNNQVSMMRAQLATQIADPARRLAAIHASMVLGKQLTGSLRALVPTDAPTLGAPWLLAGLSALVGRTPLAAHLPLLANVAISNVPGPPVPLYLAGGKMTHYWPASIIVHGVALNVTVQSYCESLEFGLVACREAMPDLKSFARGLKAAFAEYRTLAHAKAPPTARRPRAAKAAAATPSRPRRPAARPRPRP